MSFVREVSRAHQRISGAHGSKEMSGFGFTESSGSRRQHFGAVARIAAASVFKIRQRPPRQRPRVIAEASERVPTQYAGSRIGRGCRRRCRQQDIGRRHTLSLSVNVGGSVPGEPPSGIRLPRITHRTDARTSGLAIECRRLKSRCRRGFQPQGNWQRASRILLRNPVWSGLDKPD